MALNLVGDPRSFWVPSSSFSPIPATDVFAKPKQYVISGLAGGLSMGEILRKGQQLFSRQRKGPE